MLVVIAAGVAAYPAQRWGSERIYILGKILLAESIGADNNSEGGIGGAHNVMLCAYLTFVMAGKTFLATRIKSNQQNSSQRNK